MSDEYENLAKKVRSWGNQLEAYNDGCQCVTCLSAIKEGFNKAIDDLIEFQKKETNG